MKRNLSEVSGWQHFQLVESATTASMSQQWTAPELALLRWVEIITDCVATASTRAVFLAAGPPGSPPYQADGLAGITSGQNVSWRLAPGLVQSSVADASVTNDLFWTSPLPEIILPAGATVTAAWNGLITNDDIELHVYVSRL